MTEVRLITVAIHTYERALALRTLLESEGIEVELNNVNLEAPCVSSGVRVRIKETDLPLALRIIENTDVFTSSRADRQESNHLVVVPTDFSELSLRAAKIAFFHADKHNAEIILLHSYVNPYIPGNMQLADSLPHELSESANHDNLLNAAKTKMADFSNRILAMMKTGELPVVKFSHKIVEGVPEDAIIDYAKINPPLLVVMGTRSNARKERELIGSVTAEVLNGSRCCVLTVPERGKVTATPKSILFFCNLDQADILAADTLFRLNKVSDSNVTIVYIPTKKRYGERKRHLSADALLDYCRRNYPKFNFTYTSIDASSKAERDFLKLENQNKFDMIVVQNRKRNAWSRLFNPGLAQRIIFRTDVSTLVIPV